MLNYTFSCSSQICIRVCSPFLISLLNLPVPTLCAYSEMKPGDNTCSYANFRSNNQDVDGGGGGFRFRVSTIL